MNADGFLLTFYSPEVHLVIPSVVNLLTICQSSPEKQTTRMCECECACVCEYVCVYLCLIYFKELAHVIVEAW